MKVIPFIADKSGCGFYRIEVPANALMAADSGIEYVMLNRQPGVVKGEKLVSIDPEFLEDIDVAIIQRPSTSLHLQLLRVYQQNGTSVIVEVDDLLHDIDKRSTAKWKPHNLAVLATCAREADLVTCTTPLLAERYAPHGRYAIIPNYVPSSMCEIYENRIPKLVGWSGTVANHPGDLQTTAGGVQSALEATNGKFRVIGHPQLVQQNLGLQKPPQCIPWAPLDTYPHELAQLDVGIIPLADTLFNRSKSWLKGIEMAAVGVPFVASNVGEYKKLPFGLLASTHDEWRDNITKLTNNCSFHASMQSLGRETVRRNYTIENHVEEWIDAFQRSIEYSRTS